jgi:glycosyltransferase involved in cell wall biosynthesis
MKPFSPSIALLTGGRDKPYALGLASALLAKGVGFDFIGSDAVDSPELHSNIRVRFLKLRDQRAKASSLEKVLRVIRYYLRLLWYAATTDAVVFHALWNNKIEFFDRTLLMLYYKLLRKAIVFTVHNVNAGKRDGTDSAWNRLTLRIQYNLSGHLFVHTEMMRNELITDFGVPKAKVSVIPFGINNTVLRSNLTSLQGKRQLGLRGDEKTIFSLEI